MSKPSLEDITKQWLFSPLRMDLNRATVIFIFGSILLGWLARWLWTPFMTILGSFVLVEVLVIGFLRFDNHQAFFSVIRVREWKIGAYRAYLVFVIMALVATAVAAWAQTSGSALDQNFVGSWGLSPSLFGALLLVKGSTSPSLWLMESN